MKVIKLVCLLLLVLSLSVSASGLIKVAIIDASPDDGNVPSNVFDGKIATRFSSKGDGAYIVLGAEKEFMLEAVKIAWHQGYGRRNYFEIQVSTDNQSYTTVFPVEADMTSSGTTLELETYDVTPISTRYVKILFHRNTGNYWFSPTEIEIWGTI